VDPASASGLLEGPRGRRLCLELAREADPELHGLVFWAALAATGPSSSVVVFGPGSEEPRPEVSPEDVAARLLAVVPPLDEARLLAALGRAVDAARYWQEPDGEDLLAAHPAVRAALLPLAALVLADPAAAWLEQPVAAEQWAIAWDPAGPAAPPGGEDARARIAGWRAAALEGEERARRERPADPGANWSGEWWSTPPSQLVRSTRALGVSGPAGLHLVEDSLGWTRALATPLRGAGRVLELGSAADWAALCRAHPLEVTASRRHDWFRTTGRTGEWVIPDWAAVAEEWDAVHLTAAAYLRVTGRAIPVDERRASVVAGWAPDETFWLADLVRPVGTPVEWRREDTAWVRGG